MSIIAVISILVITISCLIYGSRLNKTLGEETNQYLSEIANQSVNVLKKQINGDIKLLESISIFIEGEESFEVDNILSILKDKLLIVHLKEWELFYQMVQHTLQMVI